MTTNGYSAKATITGARADLITVSVKPFRSTDSRGREVEIHYYERDGIYVSSYGYVLRKDGERSKQGITRLDLHAEIPQNVAQLMGSLIRPFDAVAENADPYNPFTP